MFYQVTLGELLFSLSLWFIALFKYKGAIDIRNQSKGSYIFFTLLLIVYTTFAFASGDFIHYYVLYTKISRGYIDDSMEDFYNCLIDVLPIGYYWWRLFVWGISTFLLVLTYKRIKSPVLLTCFFFVLVLMSLYSSPRNTLGYITLYYSMTFLLIPFRSKIISYLIACLGILISVFLHKSMPLYIALMLVAFVPFNRKLYIASLIAFPIIYISFDYFSEYILAQDLGEGEFVSSGVNYLEGEHFAKLTLYGYIQFAISRIPLLLLLYYMIVNVLNGTIKNHFIIHFTKYSYILVYLSFVFFNQETSSFLSNRFWDASLYSMALIIPLSVYQQKAKIISFSIYMLILANLYSIAYSIYKF